MWSETCPNIKKYKKLTLPYTVAHQILLKSSTTLVILTETSFWVHNLLLSSYLVLFTVHKSTYGPLPLFLQKSLKITTCFDIQFFYNLLFQKSAHHWKKSKQIFDITAESCYHSEHFLVIESTSENVIFYSWKL